MNYNEIFKFGDDYYENISYNEKNLDIIKQFDFRPNIPLRKTKLFFQKIELENATFFFEENINYTLQWDYFPINSSSNIYVQQNYFDVAIFIPSIIEPIIDYENNIVKIINSMNFEVIYKNIFEQSGQKMDYLNLIHTKRYYIEKSNKGFPSFNENLIKKNKGYYIIPHINIYENFGNVDGKLLCELTGTIIT